MTEEVPLSNRNCVPCRGGVPPMDEEQVSKLLQQIKGWDAVEKKRLRKTIKTKNFASALELVNKIGAVAERECHHPDIYLAWGRVTVEIWTHKIDGLTESDFILAAKIDALEK